MGQRRESLAVTRAMGAVGSAVALGAVCLVLSSTAAGAPAGGVKAPDLIATYNWWSVQCIRTETSQGPLVAARVKLWMRVVNHDSLTGKDWATHMTAKARLIPADNPGLQIYRGWTTSTTKYLTQNRTHRYNFDVTTDTKKPSATWNVQLKLIWDRTAPIKDVVKEVVRPFTACNGIELGS